MQMKDFVARKPGPGRGHKLYDWQRWFAQDRIKLQRGVHYLVPEASFVQQVRNAAYRLGYKIDVQLGYDHCVVYVRSRPETVAPLPKPIRAATDTGGWYAAAGK
jgi:hypothetical protein